MEDDIQSNTPTHCPVCQSGLLVSRLECPSCGTEVAGSFTLSRLASLRDPHASLIELFLRVRGNMKEMERELGLSYPTVRARLEEALLAAGLERELHGPIEEELTVVRSQILEELERGQISPREAAERLRELKTRRST